LEEEAGSKKSKGPAHTGKGKPDNKKKTNWRKISVCFRKKKELVCRKIICSKTVEGEGGGGATKESKWCVV